MKYNNNQTINSISGTILVAVCVLTASIAGAQSAEVLHNPSQVEITEGGTFEVVVEVHSGEQLISVADFHMHFDPEYLEVLEVSTMEGGLEANSISPVFNNAEGTIDMGSFQVGSQIPSGFIEAMQITFKGIAPTQGTSVIHPSDIFPRSILAYAGVDYLGNIGPLDITILPSLVLSDGDIKEYSDLSLELWPNPTSHYATISFRTSETGQVSLDLYDVTGKVVSGIFHGSAASGSVHQYEIDVNHLNNGLYFCRLTTEEGTLVKRLVVGK